MRNALLGVVFAGVCVFAASAPVLAHHGGSAYDTAHPLTLVGTVKDFQFIQPHPLITLEMTAPNHLVHYGWNGKKLKPGDQITVMGSPSKNGLKVLNLRKISFTNGA